MITPTEMQDHATNFFGWSIRLILFLLALAAIILVIGSFADAAECRSSPGEGGYWQWRYVKPYESRRCWYRGHQQLPKADLYWSIMKPEKMPEKQDDDSPKKQIMDPVFPRHAGAPVKVVRAEDFNELDAQASNDAFFSASPITLWSSIMRLTPFIPWTERVVGSFQ